MPFRSAGLGLPTLRLWLLVAATALALPAPKSDAAPQDPPAGVAASVQAQIAAREYWVSRQAEGLQAPNRRHGLRTFFDPSGVRIHDRSAGESPRLVELRLGGVGRGDALAAVAPGVVTSHEGRVEIRREDAGLVEWYLNSPAGLEQGFTLAERPGADARGELVFELAVAGAQASRRGSAVALATDAGRKLAYGKLVVVDAAGRGLTARMEVPAPDRIRLIVADAGATYPIVVDPLLEGTADTQLESDQIDAAAGYAASTAGDVNGDGYADVLVGAHAYDDGQTDEGAVFLFLGAAGGIADAGAAGAGATLTGQQAGALFGWSVAPAGDVDGDGYADVIIGARSYDDGETDEGAAFLFHGSASGLVGSDPASAAARLQSDQASAELGFAVAGAGDVDGDGYADVIVGAPSYDAGQTDEGAAFLFHGSASGVADGSPASAATQLESDQASASLGVSVASAGDVDGDGHADVVVGAELFEDGETDEGLALVFLGGSGGIANGTRSSAHAEVQGNQAGAWLGRAVASAGDVNGDGYSDVMVSSPRYDDGQTDEGRVSVFFGSASGIASGDPSSADDGVASDQASAHLGERIGTLGDVNGDGYADVAVGAPLYDDGQTDEGGAWVFLGGPDGIAAGSSATTPSAADHLLSANQAGAGFGANVAGAGDVDGDGYADLLVGADLYQDGEADEGAAFVYRGGAGITDGSPATAHAQLESNQGSSSFGASLSSAGDVNGDGYDDLIVGAYRYDAGQADEGAAFVFLGSATGIADGSPATAHAQLESNEAFSLFGGSVASAGDVNGDGYGDVIVGAAFYDAGQADEGAAFVFLGSPSGIASGTPASAHARLESNEADTVVTLPAMMGFSVSSAGDVNGDGYGDVIVGAPWYDAGQADEGAAFIFLGSSSGIASGTPATAHARLESNLLQNPNQRGVGMGRSVSSAGDVNGDGYGDVVVGASFYSNGQNEEGAAFVFLGSSSGVANGSPATAHARLEGDKAIANFGGSVASAGDVNGDGYSDLIIGAHEYDSSLVKVGGAAFVYLGSATGIAHGSAATAHAQLKSNEDDLNGYHLGGNVSSAGDVNGDGYGDVVVSANMYQSYAGAAFVFLGSAAGIASGPLTTADARLEMQQAHASRSLNGLASADVNGDGFSDVVVGAEEYDAGQLNEGAAFVFLGNAAGRPVLARQLRGDGSGAVVAAWGAADDADAFEVRLVATSPDGRARAQLEVEWCAPGEPFGDASCGGETSSVWTDVGATPGGVTLSHVIDGLDPGALYRWRARVLHGPLSVTQSGITAPPLPAHGPWRRLAGQAREADVRIAALVPACDDGRDTDGDGAVDHPADPGCSSASDVSERESGLACDDGVDNDADGRTDAPFDCGPPGGSTEVDCGNGADDDRDGLSDYPVDLGCTGAADTSERQAGVGLVCDDGVDNDFDSYFDEPDDPGCFNASSTLEDPKCQNGLDDDGDQRRDFDGGYSLTGTQNHLADPQCAGFAHKNKESPNCGLGFELAPLLVLLIARRRRSLRGG